MTEGGTRARQSQDCKLSRQTLKGRGTRKGREADEGKAADGVGTIGAGLKA